MLNLDPDHRITTIEALAHPYLAQYSDPEDEPTAEEFDQSLEEKDLDIQSWKSESCWYFLWADWRPKKYCNQIELFSWNFWILM